jgi:DNA repair protein RecN (Recombination protein N)
VASKLRKIRELSIRNIGVIDQASLELGAGLNVITGETGAGKTMVLTGLNLITGTRSDVDLIREGCDRLSASVLLSLEPDPAGVLGDLLAQHDPTVEQGSLLLQRSITRDGRSKAIIGSDPSTLSLLQQFASEFFVIHGQSTNHKLLDRSYQMELLDRTSDEVGAALESYRSNLLRFKERERELKDLRSALDHREREIAKLSQFIDEMDRQQLIAGEWRENEIKINRLDSVEEIRSAIAGALNGLDDEADGAVGKIQSAIRSLDQFKAEDDTYRGYGARLRNAQIEINEIVVELRREIESLDVDPGELDLLRERRASLKRFLQRHRSEAPEVLEESEALDHLLSLLPKRKALLADLQGSDQRLDQLVNEVEVERERVQLAAETVTRERGLAAQLLSEKVNLELRELGLGRASFVISIAGDPSGSLGKDGVDRVEFLFSSHESGKPLPLNKGASGGELSRVMLAIELAFADHREIGTLIFDEIDAGIGGEAGLIIGERISRLARFFQIIVITHLAQVAVWADRHFRIEKDEDDRIVFSSVSEVSDEERVSEIARMLSGQSGLDVAKEHARELLKHAGR